MRQSTIKHAILIIAHLDHDAVLRLIKSLKHERVRVFVHLDRSTIKQFDLKALTSEGATVKSFRSVNWGGYSVVDATLQLLTFARTSESFASYSLLSGQDYPLIAITRLVTELDELKCSYIDYWTDENPAWHKRYERYYFHDNRMSKFLNAISRRVSRILPRRSKPPELKVFFGSTWWTLLHEHVEQVLSFANENPSTMKWYRHIHIPDESLVQTAILNSKNGLCLDRNTRRFISFTDSAAHPDFIQQKDLSRALSGRFWFGRKFDERQFPGVLDTIDAKLAGISSGDAEQRSISGTS
jgi:Core-2/I-Branching enzyme